METPFVFGKIATDQNFTDRRVETERLLQNFSSLTNTIIISPRRWGKSSLVTHAAKQLLMSEENVKLCMIDLFNVREEEGFYTLLAKEVLTAVSSKWEEIAVNAKNFLARLIPRISFTADVESELSFGIGLEELKRNPDDILDFDLYLYICDAPTTVGMNDAFVTSPRIDNISSVCAILEGLASAEPSNTLCIGALFDNEEIGNTSKQGAASILLHDMVKRIYRSLGCSEEETDCAMYGGMLLSVDVAHALHPNHKEKMDITNHPVLGDGFCIKEACSQSYATDAKAIGILRQLCDQNKIAYQRFVNRSDVRGGGTLGSVASTLFPVRTVDIGIPLLSMHSARELMGRTDFDALASAVTAYFS